MATDRTINANDIDESRSGEPDNGLALMIVTSSSITSVPVGGRTRLVVGRGETADVQLEDPLASKQHARLDLGEIISVVDLGSTNGTHVRDVRIAAQQPAVIQLGEGVRIGATIVMVQRVRSARTLARKVWEHADFKERVEEECARAALVSKTLTLARLQFAAGASAGDRVEGLLRQLVGSPHILARYARSEYEILLTELPAEEAEATVKTWMDHLQTSGLAPRLGLAFFPRDGRSIEALLSSSNARLVERDRPAATDHDGLTDALDDRPLGDTMRGIYKLARKAAASDMNILILGETGVGKEVMAQAIHSWSARAKQDLHTINCAGLSETLLESELFGHEKGAFTDARQAKAGLLEAATGGTVFFDELGEMSAKMQQRLLRALQTREITRVGSVKPRKIDVRVIAATNRDMEAEVQAGNFRSDLFYRFGGFILNVPPLRERLEEIPWLAARFANAMCEVHGRAHVSFSAAALALLDHHNWPGNIRELKNVVDRAVVLSDGDVIGAEHIQLPSAHNPGVAAGPLAVEPRVPQGDGYRGRAETPGSGRASDFGAPWGPLLPPERPLDATELGERDQMLGVLSDCLWNISEASRQYPMPRRTFVSKMKRYGIPGPRSKTLPAT